MTEFGSTVWKTYNEELEKILKKHEKELLEIRSVPFFCFLKDLIKLYPNILKLFILPLLNSYILAFIRKKVTNARNKYVLVAFLSMFNYLLFHLSSSVILFIPESHVFRPLSVL